ncbi:hypothetical protein NH288_04645 [Anaerococcus sp. NML200537]|uniref:hypothetical protein n=1 Tax=Anaerococcus sp. NML200537 TaxID=2954485 RepID=UPI002238BA4F|nr:hypothetical protein [Anaerococcus sp. NML200537]MCW6701371.1 hypothetical protein [Anaerococcus sp. NML200537]
MKKRFTLLIAMVMLLTAMATNVFASSADNNSEVIPKEVQEWFNGLSKEEQLSVNYELLQSLRLSEKDIEWLKWYNTLSKEQQWAVNYFPSQLLKVFNVNFDDLKVNEDMINEDKNIKANKPARKAGNNAKTGIAGVAGVTGILTAASVAYGVSKRD